MKRIILISVFVLLSQPVQAFQNDYNYALRYCDLITTISRLAATLKMNDADKEDAIQYFQNIDDQSIKSISEDMVKQLLNEAYLIPIEYDQDLQRQVIKDFSDKNKSECLEQTIKAEQNSKSK